MKLLQNLLRPVLSQLNTHLAFLEKTSMVQSAFQLERVPDFLFVHYDLLGFRGGLFAPTSTKLVDGRKHLGIWTGGMCWNATLRAISLENNQIIRSDEDYGGEGRYLNGDTLLRIRSHSGNGDAVEGLRKVDELIDPTADGVVWEASWNRTVTTNYLTSCPKRCAKVGQEAGGTTPEGYEDVLL
jgi:hypothetical protein